MFRAERTLGTLEAVAEGIAAAGGTAETAEVDALDGRPSSSMRGAWPTRQDESTSSSNAISLGDVQGTPLLEMPLEEYRRPIAVGISERDDGDGGEPDVRPDPRMTGRL